VKLERQHNTDPEVTQEEIDRRGNRGQSAELSQDSPTDPIISPYYNRLLAHH
jgi:hypothetical protein